MNTLHPMLKQHAQRGTTLTGVMIGLVVAVAIIALLMWYMNTHKTTFQPYTPPEPPPEKPEVLRPQDTTTPPETPALSPDTAQDDLGQLIGRLDQPETDQKSTETETVKPIIARKTQPPKVVPQPQDMLEGTVKPVAPPSKNTGTTVLQIGSFATRTQAESQQAKLMMLDVKTRIETAEVGGKIVYRVRSSLSPAQAQAVQQRLSENQIDSIVLPNP